MKKWTTLTLVSMMTLALLTGCGSGNSNNDSNAAASSNKPSASNGNSASPVASESAEPAESEIKGEISFATHRVDQIEHLERYAEAFKKKYPGITDVKIEGIKDYSGVMKVRIAAGELPDVFSLIAMPPAEYPNYYEPLDDLGLNDRIWFKEFTTYDGKLYAISQQAAINGLVYNKEVFKTVGIEGPPKTLAEFYDICEKLKAAGYVPMATGFKDAWTLQYYEKLSEFIYGNANLRNDKLKTETPFTVDGPYGQGLTIFKTMYDKGYLASDILSETYDQNLRDMASGKVVMSYIGNWVIQPIVQAGGKLENYGFAPMPHDNSGKLYGNIMPDWSYAVNKDSKNKAAAKAFIKFMLEESGDNDEHMTVSPLKDAKPNTPYLEEFYSYNPEMMESLPVPDDVDAVEKKMQYKYRVLLQEAVLGDMKAVFDDYNKKWNEARKELGK